MPIHRLTRRIPVGVLLFLPLLFAAVDSHATWSPFGNPVAATTADEFLTEEYNAAVSPGGGLVVGYASVPFGGLASVRVQKMDEEGQALWGAAGALVYQASQVDISMGYTQIAADGIGGAIITWVDNRLAPGTAVFDLYVQRVDSNGVSLWASGGILLDTGPIDYFDVPRVVGDGQGGALVAWLRGAGGSRVGRAQRIDALGTELGAPGGVVTFPVGVETTQQDLVADDAGNAFLCGSRAYSDFDVEVLRFDLTGSNPNWVAAGSTFASASTTDETMGHLVPDGQGGVYLLFTADGADLRVQRFAASTLNAVWSTPAQASFFSTGETDYSGALEPLSGDLLVQWSDVRTSATTGVDIYAQRFGPDGALRWPNNGIAATTRAGSQRSGEIIADPDGTAILAWRDDALDSDLHVQGISVDGLVLWAENGVRLVERPGSQLDPQLYLTANANLMVLFQDGAAGVNDIRLQRVDPRHGYWGQPAGTMTALRDIDNDQGGYLEANWLPSDHDRLGLNTITHYSVWRSTSAITKSGAPSNLVDPGEVIEGFVGDAFMAAAGYYWEYVGQQAAGALPGYGYSVPTTANAIDTAVQVIAHTADPFVTFPSTSLLGQSLDNLAPAPPLALNGQRTGGSTVSLGWQPSGENEPDFGQFELYRSLGSTFDLGTATLVAAGPDTSAVDGDADPAAVFTYAVVATDVNGNSSAISNPATVDSEATPVEDGFSISRLMLRPNAPNPFSGTTSVRFSLPKAGPVELRVFDLAGRRVRTVRREMEAGSHALPFDARDQNGRELAAGVYMMQLRAGDEVVTGRMSLVR